MIPHIVYALIATAVTGTLVYFALRSKPSRLSSTDLAALVNTSGLGAPKNPFAQAVVSHDDDEKIMNNAFSHVQKLREEEEAVLVPLVYGEAE